MEPKKHEIVTPKPYFKISFGCSNRAFYEVKNELFQIASGLDIEIQDGYITEKCDYEGDLEVIIIYAVERGRKLIDAVLYYYKVDDSIPKDMNLHLSIF